MCIILFDFYCVHPCTIVWIAFCQFWLNKYDDDDDDYDDNAFDDTYLRTDKHAGVAGSCKFHFLYSVFSKKQKRHYIRTVIVSILVTTLFAEPHQVLCLLRIARSILRLAIKYQATIAGITITRGLFLFRVSKQRSSAASAATSPSITVLRCS